MPGFLSPGKGVPLLLIPEYSGINKGQRGPDRSKTAHGKPLVKCVTERLTLHLLKNHIFILIDAGKASDKNSTPIYDKNSSESGQRGNLPQHNKGHT